MEISLVWIENIIGSCWGKRSKGNIPRADSIDEHEHYWRRNGEIWIALCNPKEEAYPHDSFSGIPILGLWQAERRADAKLCKKCTNRVKMAREKDIWF